MLDCAALIYEFQGFGWWERCMGQRHNKEPPMSKPTQSKKSRLISMLMKGAKITQLTKSLKWQPHTVRAAISKLRKAGSVIEQSSVRGDCYYKMANGTSSVEEVAS